MMTSDVSLAELKHDIRRIAQRLMDNMNEVDHEAVQVKALVQAAILGNGFSVLATCRVLRGLASELESKLDAHLENANCGISEQIGQSAIPP